MDPADLQHRFAYHPPKDESAVRAHEGVRDAHLRLAGLIDGACPDGREKSLAITKLEESMMWANAAIARDG